MPRIPTSHAAVATSSSKKYMSQKVVTPVRTISAAPSRVPQRTESAVRNSRSAGQMYCCSQVSSGRSSASPRKSVIGVWVCAFTRPGRSSASRASIVRAAVCVPSTASRGPTATISPARTATAPASSTVWRGSIVTTIPPTSSRSTVCGPAPGGTLLAVAIDVGGVDVAAGRRRRLRQIAHLHQRVEHSLDAAEVDAHAQREWALLLDVQLVGGPRILGRELGPRAQPLDRLLLVRRVVQPALAGGVGADVTRHGVFVARQPVAADVVAGELVVADDLVGVTEAPLALPLAGEVERLEQH